MFRINLDTVLVGVLHVGMAQVMCSGDWHDTSDIGGRGADGTSFVDFTPRRLLRRMLRNFYPNFSNLIWIL